MFNFDDEIVIGFYDQVPWLLLLNLLAMFLLIFLLCYSTIFALDITNESIEEGDSQLHRLQSRSNNSNSVFINNCTVLSQNDNKANQHQTATRRHASSSTLRRGSSREVEEIRGGERLSATDAVTQKALSSCSSLSPCHWLEIASKAFLSCLGLHTESEDSPRSKKRNERSCDDHSNSSTGSKQHQL